tara:strand:+ start:5402 stop:6106 length:705 start_codon:yes stop_codon:yes gene_type:complete
MNQALCWICEKNPADSKEHMVKASDLRALYGKISHEMPVYFHGGKNKNIPVRSAKSNRFKTGPVICQKCNNSGTASHDEAWAKFARYTLSNWKSISENRKIKMQRIYPGSTRRDSILMQLYFCKLFGCRIADEEIPIDLAPFRQSIINNEPHPGLFLIFTNSRIDPKGLGYSGISEVHALEKQGSGKPMCATWYYSLGEFCVQLMWYHSSFNGRLMPYSWNPLKIGKIINIRTR